MDTKIFRHLLHNTDIHPIVVDLALSQYFTTDWWFWEPETIYIMLKREFNSTPPSSNKNCILAVKALHINPNLFDNYLVFEKVVLALNNLVPTFTIIEKPSVGHLLHAIFSVKALSPEIQLSDEVKKYIAGIIAYDAAYPVHPLLKEYFEFAGLEEGVPNINIKDDLIYFLNRKKQMLAQFKELGIEWKAKTGQTLQAS
jgi:hypothetical protein